MDLFSLFLIAIGLAMDAFSVSVTDGIILKGKLKFRNAFKIGLFFGIFQAVMPCIGYVLGFNFKSYIESVDHWVALILLGFIGGKMLYDGIRGGDDEEAELEGKNPLDNKVLTILAVATSIDALAVGITLATMDCSLALASGVIGTVAFVLSIVGVYIGNKCGNLFGNKADIVGGLVLVGIGLKILIEHLFFV